MLTFAADAQIVSGRCLQARVSLLAHTTRVLQANVATMANEIRQEEEEMRETRHVAAELADQVRQLKEALQLERDQHLISNQRNGAALEEAAAREEVAQVEVRRLHAEIQRLVDASVEERERHRREEDDLSHRLGFSLAEKEAAKRLLATEVARVREAKQGAIEAYGEQVRQLQADKQATAARFEAQLREQVEDSNFERARLASACEVMRAEHESCRQQAEDTLASYVSFKEDETLQLQRALGRAHMRHAPCAGTSRGRMLSYSTTLKEKLSTSRALVKERTTSAPRARPA